MRELSALTVAELEAEHLEPVTLVHLAFDEPIFVHSAIGTIPHLGNEYQGVGALGSIEAIRESEELAPVSLVATLSGIDANMIEEALTAGRFGDIVTIYEGYRQDDGTLVDNAWDTFEAKLDSTSVVRGEQGTVQVTLQHRLSDIEEIDGSRFTDEDQQNRYSGDLFFQHIADIPNQVLIWAGGPSRTGNRPRPRPRPGSRR